jgi:hypothetical protein
VHRPLRAGKEGEEEVSSLLLDVGALPCGCVDHALEHFSKALSGEDGESPDIWAKHESPFIQSLIELFTSRGLLRLEKVKQELEAWAAGKRHKAGGAPAARPKIPGLQWTDEEAMLVKVYLENLPPEQFTASDWALVVDYLAQRYFPSNVIQSEAEWLAMRSSMMGKVAAHYAAVAVTVAQADAILAALPLTVADTVQTFGYKGAAVQILEYARERCCDQVVQLSDQMRHRMKKVILDYEQQKIEGANPPAAALATRLFDEFSALNRDWRRIAVTEAGENANQGLIASLPLGTRVKRLEQYRGACPFCKKINGRVLTVVDPAKRNKDGELEVWLGKNNLGRSGSPRKRVGDALVEREPHEKWWIPAGTVHPHCRGQWHVLTPPPPGSDPGFAAWLDKHVHKYKVGPQA